MTSSGGGVHTPRPAEAQTFLMPPANAAIFVVLRINDGAHAAVRDALTGVSALVRTVGYRDPRAELSCVIGVASQAWDGLYAAPRPARLHPFEELVGPRHTAPATPGDLLVHLRARRLDLCFEFARILLDQLAGQVEVVDEVHGFRYFDERDLLGFVDGSESPDGQAAADAVLIDDDPPFNGGTYIVVQKYLHDLTSWNRLTVEEQERAIGRHKLSNVEIPDEDKAANSHVALNTITDPDGTQRQIVRDNMPFGSLADGEFGTYFIGYAADPGVIEQMLRNMFLGSPPGNHDRVLDFSTAETGVLFFAPSAAFLDDPPEPAAPASVEPPAEPVSDGSLGIGSLKSPHVSSEQ